MNITTLNELRAKIAKIDAKKAAGKPVSYKMTLKYVGWMEEIYWGEKALKIVSTQGFWKPKSAGCYYEVSSPSVETRETIRI